MKIGLNAFVNAFRHVGHVGHGKSTILGRLLAESKSLFEGKLDRMKAYCERNSKPSEYAFLIDALKDDSA